MAETKEAEQPDHPWSVRIRDYMNCILGRIVCIQCKDAAYFYRCRTYRGRCVCVWFLCVLGTPVSCAKRLNRSRCRLGTRNPQNTRNLVSDGGSDPPTGRGSFERGMCRPIVTYLRMNAFRTVRPPPLANVPAQCTRRTNLFAASRGDKSAMRPFAKLLWTLVLEIKRGNAVIWSKWRKPSLHFLQNRLYLHILK